MGEGKKFPSKVFVHAGMTHTFGGKAVNAAFMADAQVYIGDPLFSQKII